MLRGVSFFLIASLLLACSRSIPARLPGQEDGAYVSAVDPAEEEEMKRREPNPHRVDGATKPLELAPPKLIRLQAAERGEGSDVREHARIAEGALPLALKEAITETPLPVLLPSARSLGDERAYERASFIGTPLWYSVGFSFEDGLNLELRGVGAAREHSGLSALGNLDPEEPTLSRTHGIVDLSFSRFGIGYALQIECADPLQDPRCIRDEFVGNIFESLLLVERAP